MMIICTSFFVLAGCSIPNEKAVKPVTKHTTVNKKVESANTNSNVMEKTESELQKLELDHINLSFPKEWSMKKGLDSASFQPDGKIIGGIDGLGYSDSIEGLLPNQSKILEKKEIPSLPFKTYSVILQRDTTSGEISKEIHIVYVSPEKKIAYDLHFNLNEVNEANALKIAKTATEK